MDKGNNSCLEKFRNQDFEENIFWVTLNIRIEKDDVLEMYFIDNPLVKSFKPDKKIRLPIKGNINFQDLSFQLPTEKVPTMFRIDLGENDLQEHIDISEIKIDYNQNSIIIKDSLLKYFFVINDYLTLKSKNGDFNIIKKKNKRDPFIISNPVLNKKIEIEF